MTMQYNAGNGASIGAEQFNTFLWQRQSLTEAAKDAVFSQLADTTSMPKHHGKEIKLYHYLPMLDDANINDQGIDANGAVTQRKTTIEVTPPDRVAATSGLNKHFFTGEGANDAASVTAAEAKFQAFFTRLNLWDTNIATTRTALTNAGWVIAANVTVPINGNLYGSSKDVGTIVSKLPSVGENGGRVNRVGYTRVDLRGTMEKLGFFHEYTQDSLDFDTDAQLMQHLTREMIRGAYEITEDALQIDLLNAAGVVYFGGTATRTNEVTGETAAPTKSELTFETLRRLNIELDNNRCPKNTTMITGTRMIDTRTVNNARFIYIGPELIGQVEDLRDNFDQPAFVPARQYAAGTTLAKGEIGAAGHFRFIVAQEMTHWAGAGAAVTNNAGYRETDGNYDVFPMLAVGSGSFTQIGFQHSGSSMKFTMFNRKPGMETADKTDPYGEQGFASIKWWFGSLIKRPEHIALIKVVAKW